ncbi:hypothetical protein F4782DRAFT_330855 [Xylaria castorea]|nr:hypothetical protein F4782DRAFT_330855 [Xylaria castorea]
MNYRPVWQFLYSSRLGSREVNLFFIRYHIVTLYAVHQLQFALDSLLVHLPKCHTDDPRDWDCLRHPKPSGLNLQYHVYNHMSGKAGSRTRSSRSRDNLIAPGNMVAPNIGYTRARSESETFTYRDEGRRLAQGEGLDLHGPLDALDDYCNMNTLSSPCYTKSLNQVMVVLLVSNRHYCGWDISCIVYKY